jgi:hypothetical protein
MKHAQLMLEFPFPWIRFLIVLPIFLALLFYGAPVCAGTTVAEIFAFTDNRLNDIVFGDNGWRFLISVQLSDPLGVPDISRLSGPWGEPQGISIFLNSMLLNHSLAVSAFPNPTLANKGSMISP